MITTVLQRTTRTFMAAIVLATVALGVAVTPSVDADGLRNCADITGPQSGRVGCYENVWLDGVQVRMTFANTSFAGSTPKQLDPFYVLAPQTSAPQGWPPNTFLHDHVVRRGPTQNHGNYSVRLQGIFVLCSGQGIVSGVCVPSWTSAGPDQLPFARTVHGQPLTSAGAIESAADAGLVALIDLGPAAVIVGTISGH